jgi:hypothetical protein
MLPGTEDGTGIEAELGLVLGVDEGADIGLRLGTEPGIVLGTPV